MIPDIDPVLSWFQDNVPTVVAIVLLLLAGYILARIARAGLRRAASAVGAGSDGAWARFFAALGRVVFWIILLTFTVAAIQLARRSKGDWIDRLGELAPRLLGGAAILVGGALLSIVVRDLALRWLSQVGVEQARTLARAAQLVVLLTTFVVGVDQLGIEVTFLVTMIAILTGGVVLAIGLGFALGAADLVRNLLAARDARRHCKPGQRVRIGDVEGELLEITPTVLVLATSAGQVTVPARVFHESPVVQLGPVTGNG